VQVKHKRVAIAVAACLVAAGLGLGALAAVRAARGNPVVSASPRPTASTGVLPSAATSPPTRGFRKALGPACLIQEVRGDFDGDRVKDQAFSWMPEPSGGCPSDPPFGPFVLTVFRANSGERVDLQMTDRCDGRNCGYLARTDLNGDGKSELAGVTWTGASDDFYHVFGFVGGRLIALPVAPPGVKGYPAGAPIEFDIGGSALVQAYLTCEKDEASGDIIVLAHGFTAHTDDQGRQRWAHSESAFRFDGQVFKVLYQDPHEEFPPSYDPSRDRLLKELRCWRTLP
jgi:hypothetical protein